MSLFSKSSIPDLPLLGLTEDERQLIETLEQSALLCQQDMLLSEAYYLGEQVVKNLRIAVPKELEFLRTIVGWPAIAVDPLVERLNVDGFRLPDATDADEHLAELWSGNGMEAEQSIAFTDALSMGHAFWCVGSPVESDGVPLITIESPLNMSVLWNLRGTEPRAAMQEYWSEDRRHAALIVPGKTVHLAVDDAGAWVVAERDEHGFDFVPVGRIANQPRTNNRDGRSEITPALRSITDAACRTLLGLEVARELYSVPQKVILGATESAFVSADGAPKTAFDTYITKVLGLERDEEGNLPEIKQMQPYDPSVFTKLIEMYASQAAGELAATPQDLGLYTQGNPTSAEAREAGEHSRNLRAGLRQNTFSVPLVKMMQTAVRFENNGVLPEKYRRLATDWSDVAQPSMSMASDAISKQVTAGSVPPTSDVTLKKLGYSRVDRARLEQDRLAAEGLNALQQIADSVTAPTAQEPANGAAAGI